MSFYFKSYIFLIVIFFSITFNSNCQNTNIAGVVNNYTSVSRIVKGVCKDTVVIDSSIHLRLADKVLIIQMNGAATNKTNSSTFGTITNLNGAGNYEFAVIDGIINNKIILQDSLKKQFNNLHKIQLVKIPSYKNATIVGNLIPFAWDGKVGGIVAIDVEDTLFLQSDIIADGSGFRGGRSNLTTYFSLNACNVTKYFNPIGDKNGGEKGEGISSRDSIYRCGRGNLANAGGGGNSHNSGGGGGGNYGAGGLGGMQAGICFTNLSTGGIGGRSNSYSNARTIFMGAGGGGGEANNNGGTAGGNGGGLIIIAASYLKSNGHKISSNGDSALTASADGSGGGGSGGTILMGVDNYIDSANVRVEGGDGGDNNNVWSCFGPGGGGGGGLIWTNNIAIPTNFKYSFKGGGSGRLIGNFPCNSTRYGALDGEKGGLRNMLNINIPDPLIILASIGNDTTLCPNDSLILNASFPNATYRWQDNSTDSLFVVTKPATYKVEITVRCHSFTDTIKVDYIASTNVDLGVDTSLCPNESLILNASSKGATYRWQDNSNDSIFVVSQPGTYWVEVSNSCGSSHDTINVDYEEIINVNLGADTTLCPNTFLTLNAFSPGATYRWQDNSTDSTFVVSKAGDYWVEVTDRCNSYYDSIRVNYQNIEINLGNDTVLCAGETLILNAGVPNATYRWQDNSSGATYIVSKAGTYWVEVRKGACVAIDSIKVTQIENISNATLGQDTTICIGESILLAPKTFQKATYLWNTGATSGMLRVDEAGEYWVEIRNECFTFRDTIVVDFKNCNCYLFIPNAFTPTFDGLNETFKPESEAFLSTSICNISDYRFLIFNRWGEKVFETNDYKQGWNGKNKGRLASPGVYVYKLRYRLDSIPKRRFGSVVLLK